MNEKNWGRRLNILRRKRKRRTQSAKREQVRVRHKVQNKKTTEANGHQVLETVALVSTHSLSAAVNFGSSPFMWLSK